MMDHFFKKYIFLVTLSLKLLEPIILSLLSNVEVINKFTHLVNYTAAKHGVSHTLKLTLSEYTLEGVVPRKDVLILSHGFMYMINLFARGNEL